MTPLQKKAVVEDVIEYVTATDGPGRKKLLRRLQDLERAINIKLPRMSTPTEIAEAISVNRILVSHWVQEGRCPGIRVPGLKGAKRHKLLIPIDEFVAWLESGRVKGKKRRTT